MVLQGPDAVSALAVSKYPASTRSVTVPEVAHDLDGQHSLVLLTGDQGGAGGAAVLEELAQVAPIVAV